MGQTVRNLFKNFVNITTTNKLYKLQQRLKQLLFKYQTKKYLKVILYYIS